jgi:photosystem II stability/assembly factor-like uncharacterized protein
MTFISIDSMSAVISDNNTIIAIAVTATSSLNNYIWISSDSGYTWVARTNSPNNAWSFIAGSSDAVILYAINVAGDIYKNTNSGTGQWLRIFNNISTLIGWTSITSDSTGRYIALGTNGYEIYTSNNFGASFIPRTVSPQVSVGEIASDSTGKYLVGISSSNYIYTSDDYGVTWTARVSPGLRSWNGVSCSSYGNNIVATDYNQTMWASSDFGVTWVRQAGGNLNNWGKISCSGSSNILIVSSQTFLTIGNII